jgi:hypothetical protein
MIFSGYRNLETDLVLCRGGSGLKILVELKFLSINEEKNYSS